LKNFNQGVKIPKLYEDPDSLIVDFKMYIRMNLLVSYIVLKIVEDNEEILMDIVDNIRETEEQYGAPMSKILVLKDEQEPDFQNYNLLSVNNEMS